MGVKKLTWTPGMFLYSVDELLKIVKLHGGKAPCILSKHVLCEQ